MGLIKVPVKTIAGRYDFAADGGLQGQILLNKVVTIPLNAVIFYGCARGYKALTSGGAATISVDVTGIVGGLIAALAVASWGANQIIEGIDLPGASQGAVQARATTDCEQPCPSHLLQATNSFCTEHIALKSNTEGMPFSLRNALVVCAIEPALPAMKNDIWFDTQATCTGNMIVQTCESDLGQPSPDTTLAVYRGLSCPPVMRVGANDDATLKPDVCSIGRALCESDEDCIRGCSGLGSPCDTDEDCPGDSVCDTTRLMLCETKVDGVGESSGAVCSRDTDCDRGLCESDLATPCDVSRAHLGQCADGSYCIPSNPCTDWSVCTPESGLRPEGDPAGGSPGRGGAR